MNDTDSVKPDTVEIPKKIFNQFVEELKNTNLPIATIRQLEKAIVTEGNLSEQAIRAALSTQAES